MRGFLWALACSGLIVLGLGYSGDVWAMADSVAVIRVPVAIGLLVLAVWLRRPFNAAFILVIAAAIALAPIIYGMTRSGQAGPVTVYQKNVLHEADNFQPTIQDMLDRHPDLITLAEVTRADHPVLVGLAQDYPSQHWCRFKKKGGTAVASHWPKIPGSERCLTAMGVAAMQVAAPGGPLWVAAVHLQWPFPSSQSAQVRRLVPEFEQLDGPIVIGGDFNMLAWGHSINAIAQATGTHRIGKISATYWVKHLVPLGIDHVLAAGDGTIEILPKFTSDHAGVLAYVDPGKGYGE